MFVSGAPPSVGQGATIAPDTSKQMSTRPSSTIHFRIPITDWKYAASLGFSSGVMSSPGRYDVCVGVSALLGSLPSLRSRYCSTFLTASCTYCDEPKAHALTPFPSSTSRMEPPKYRLGGVGILRFGEPDWHGEGTTLQSWRSCLRHTTMVSMSLPYNGHFPHSSTRGYRGLR
jgi:hypothetical protein